MHLTWAVLNEVPLSPATTKSPGMAGNWSMIGLLSGLIVTMPAQPPRIGASRIAGKRATSRQHHIADAGLHEVEEGARPVHPTADDDRLCCCHGSLSIKNCGRLQTGAVARLGISCLL